MISLELAQKLRDAGLVWKPKAGDWYCFGNSLPGLFDEDLLDYLNQRAKLFTEKYTYLPRLDQMLAEIERRGGSWEMTSFVEYSPGDFDNPKCELIRKGDTRWFTFEADTPEEAAGLALLWILQEGE